MYIYSGSRKYSNTFNLENRITFLRLHQTTWICLRDFFELEGLVDEMVKIFEKNAVDRWMTKKKVKVTFYNIFI